MVLFIRDIPTEMVDDVNSCVYTMVPHYHLGAGSWAMRQRHSPPLPTVVSRSKNSWKGRKIHGDTLRCACHVGLLAALGSGCHAITVEIATNNELLPSPGGCCAVTLFVSTFISRYNVIVVVFIDTCRSRSDKEG